MLKRSSLIPIAILNLIATTGCTPAIVGDWELTKLEVDGQRYDLSYSYGGYDFKITGTLSVEMGLDAELKLENEISYRGKIDNYVYLYDGEAEPQDKGEYDISLEGDMDMDLTCTIDDDELQCEGEGYGSDIEMSFERGD